MSLGLIADMTAVVNRRVLNKNLRHGVHNEIDFVDMVKFFSACNIFFYLFHHYSVEVVERVLSWNIVGCWKLFVVIIWH